MNDNYIEAARLLDNLCEKYLQHTNYDFNEVKSTYSKFKENYAPSIIQKYTGQKVLDNIYDIGNGDKYNESLLHYLIRHGYGSISSGHNNIYPVYYKTDGGWRTREQGNISHDEAIRIGKKFINKLIICTNQIESKKIDFSSIEGYKAFQGVMQDNLEESAERIWIHKYLHMMYPDLFSQFHSKEWKIHLLDALQIEPCESFYEMAGQIAEIRKHMKQKDYGVIAHAVYEYFPGLGNDFTCKLHLTDIGRTNSLNWNVGEYVELHDEDFTKLTKLESYKKASKEGKNPIFVIFDKDVIKGTISQISEVVSNGKTDSKKGIFNDCFAGNSSLPVFNDGNGKEQKLKNNINLSFVYKYHYGYFVGKEPIIAIDGKSAPKQRNKTKSAISYDEVKTVPFDATEEADFLKEVNETSINEICEKDNYTPLPEVLTDYEKTVISKSYPRNPKVSKAALLRADCKCEYSDDHLTFIRKSDGLPYTEPHHLIPMSQQRLFKDRKLDVQANIVSLCSFCHNLIHYGRDQDRKIIIYSLYIVREEELKQAGIWVDIETLYKMYGIS